MRLVRLAYQPPANSTFLSEQTSYQQPAITSQQYSSLRTNQHQPSAISHQPTEQADGPHLIQFSLCAMVRSYPLLSRSTQPHANIKGVFAHLYLASLAHWPASGQLEPAKNGPPFCVWSDSLWARLILIFVFGVQLRARPRWIWLHSIGISVTLPPYFHFRSSFTFHRTPEGRP
jgi:hypothetical protein